MNPNEYATPQLVASFLGGFQIARDTQPIAFATDRARGLLAYLIVEQAQPRRREQLATLLWPDDAEKSARQNLSQTLTRVRQAIDDYDNEPPFLHITRPTIQFNSAAPVTVDIVDFQKAIAETDLHVHTDLATCDACLEQLSDALELYRGPFLDGTQLAQSSLFEEWVLMTREQLQRQAIDALDALTDAFAKRGDHRRAQQYAAQQLSIEPWKESAHRQLMTALVLGGQRSAAIAQFESCRQLLADELAVEPEATTIELAEQIRRGELQEMVAKAHADEVIHDGVTHDEATPHPAPHLTAPASGQLVASSSEIIRSRLEPRHDQHIFGRATTQARIYALLQAEARPWIIAIEGIGGIGKTTLANELAHSFVENRSATTTDRHRFADIGWVSAKQEEYEPEVGQQSTGRPALDTSTLTEQLLRQLLDNPPITASAEEKRATLLQLLKAQPYLIVIDNLETFVDQEALTPYLRQLANPTKFLLTSRFSRQAHAEVYSQPMRELDETDTIALLRHEAEVRGIHALAEADAEQLRSIYRVAGGNPLALKMVAGQAGLLPLKRVLANLEEARGRRVEELYTYIYWQAWQLLNDAERQLFLSMPLVPDATLDQLSLASGLDDDQLQDALPRLLQQSLVQISGDLNERRYKLHRLTETFLMREVLKWQEMGG